MIAYLLNLLDLFFTLHALEHGAVEANPLMHCVPIMIAYKVIIVGILCWWLHKHNSSIARLGLCVCAAVFMCVNIWHIFNLIF